jgi:hypothetical protein
VLLTGGRRSNDRWLFCRQSSALRHFISDTLFASLRLCVETGWVGRMGPPKKQAHAIPIEEIICVYLRDLRFSCVDGPLCASAPLR